MKPACYKIGCVAGKTEQVKEYKHYYTNVHSGYGKQVCRSGPDKLLPFLSHVAFLSKNQSHSEGKTFPAVGPFPVPAYKVVFQLSQRLKRVFFV